MAESSDRNLLLGILALQMGFINREQLLAAMNAWVLSKTTPLEKVLLEHQALTSDTVALLQALVAKHLELHGGNAQQSLQAISLFGTMRDDLHSLEDPDIEATLTVVRASSDSQIADKPTPLKHLNQLDTAQRFRVIRPHAKGGLGEVFLARDTELNREVALKEIQERFAKNQDSRARFMLEAEVTGGLEHPGIVPVYGLGQYADGRPFYAMRFIKGDSLKDAITRFHTKYRGARDFTTGEVGVEFRQLLGRFIDVCQAIEYAHSRGVLHRDLKPGNIMLGKYGETLVVDWGLAKVIGRAERHQSSGETTLTPDVGNSSSPTQMGSTIGTPSFMSPEQAAGDHDALGPAADVYSLGATLYCVLTGEAPFANTSQHLALLLDSVKRGEFKRPREVSSGIPSSLEAVCLKAMSRLPGDRYTSPVLLADDIEHWLADEPVSCLKEPIGVRAQRWVRTHKSWAVSGVLACTLIAVVSSFAAVLINNQKNVIAEKERIASELSNRNAKLAEREKSARETTTKLLEVSQRSAEEATKSRELADKNRVEALVQRQLAEQRKTDAEAAAKSESMAKENAVRANELTKSSLERANQANALMRRSLYAAHMNLANTAWENTRVRATTDLLAQYAPGTGSEALRGFEWHYLNRLCHSEERRLKGHTASVRSVAMSPDGERMVSGSLDGTLKLWSFASGKELLTLERNASFVNSVAFSPNGKYIASAQSDRSVKVWDSASGKLMRTLGGLAREAHFVAFSPDSSRVASGGNEESIRLWNVENQDVVLELEVPYAVSGIAFSPDGKRVAGFGRTNAIEIWSVTDVMQNTAKALNRNALMDEDIVVSAAYAPNGETIVSASKDKKLRIWDPNLRKVLRTIDTGYDTALSVNYSNSGNQIVAATRDGVVRIWNAETGSSIQTLKGHSGVANCAVFTPDELHVVSAGQDGTVRIWDARRVQPPVAPTSNFSTYTDLAYSNDRLQIATSYGGKIIEFWDTKSANLVRNISVSEPMRALDFGVDGQTIVTGDYAGSISILDVKLGSVLLSWKGHDKDVADIAVNPNGSSIASSSPDGSLIIWNSSNGTEIQRLTYSSSLNHNLCFSPDGKHLAACDRGDTITIWDAPAYQARSLIGHKAVNKIAFSSDGKYLVSAGQDGTAKVWDVASGHPLVSLQGHSGPVTSAVFSPDGTRIATSSQDRTVKLWDAETGQEIITLEGADANVTFDPKGEHLAATTPDNTIINWDARPLDKTQ